MEVYINIRNFGKIGTARINISNFSVFVGNNNSGKTQVMQLIYAVVKKMALLTPDIELPQIGDINAFRVGVDEIHNLNEWVNGYLKENLSQIIEETFNTMIPAEEVFLEFQDVDIEHEIYFLNDETMEYLREKGMLSEEQLTEIIQDKERFYQSFRIIKDKKDDGNMRHRIHNKYSCNIPVGLAMSIEVGDILGEIVGGTAPNPSNILFLPASRMGFMMLYKQYFGKGNSFKDDIIRGKNQNTKGITKPVADFLSFLLDYSFTERVAKKNEQILHFIYEHLIDGTIHESGEITTYLPQNEEREIPLFVASSMVNEVVPVVKALTDYEEIDFLFYDEVETSMHPLKQIEMVKLMNRLNNHGMKLIVSTHSDTMATKINNLLLLSYADIDFDQMKKSLKKNNIWIEKEDLLVSKNIHVYQFLNNENGKSCVEELEFSRVPFTGYDFTLFNDSSMSLFEEAKIAMGIEDEN